MSGINTNGGYLARVGSFIADGNGNITAAVEDVVDLGSGLPPAIVSFTGGTYSIQANGRGAIAFRSSTGSGLLLNLIMQSNSRGFLLQTDLNAASSGSFILQTTTDFATSKIAGNYVFDVAGISFSTTSAAPISIIGQLVANGNGALTGGALDTNDGNATAPSGPTPVASGTYQLDSSSTGTNFGRGVMSFNGRTYVFYIVDATRFKLMEEDALGGTSGDAVQQSGNIPTQNSQFTGSFVYLVGGSSLMGAQGPFGRIARFAADGSGGLAGISLDENNDGNTTSISGGSGVSNATYAIDTALAGTGRGTFTFTSGSNKFAYVFYMSSNSQAVLQDVSSGVLADGPMKAQTGSPFSAGSTAGNYAITWSGIDIGPSGASPLEEDTVGQYTLSSSGNNNIAGVLDLTQLGITGSTLDSNIGVTGALAFNGDGTAKNTMRLGLGGSANTTINYAAYIASSNTVLLLCTDHNRVTAGLATKQ
jgi:hypothetical protein